MNIDIDIASLIEPFNLSADDVNEIVDYTIKEVTTRFASALELEANRTLKSARLDYISNIQVIDEGFARAAVVLTGSLPNAIEQGEGSYDMKPGLLNGPNAKMTASGVKYNTIPFSWGTPGALQENFSNVMPEQVHAIIKSKPVRDGYNSSEGVKRGELPLLFQQREVKKIKVPGTNVIQQYQHKHSVYEGIRKQQDNVTKQNRYMSFRRVSENSNPLSWIHPGHEKLDLFGKTLSNFDAPKIIGEILDEIF